MSMPFYVAPEQVMKDRADYARKGIARGRSLAAVVYDDGIVMCAENPSATLRKISEIYDRIAFAGVGKYNEFDQLRIAGIRAADLKGYSYSREDVDARSLANQYAQILGQIFTHEMKPMEVEILVAEVSDEPGTGAADSIASVRRLSQPVKGSAWGSRWRWSTARPTASTGWSRSIRMWSGCGRPPTRGRRSTRTR